MMNGQGGGGMQQQIDLAQQVTITLQLGSWNQIMGMVMQAPWEKANPYVVELNRQIGEALQRAPAPNYAAQPSLDH